MDRRMVWCSLVLLGLAGCGKSGGDYLFTALDHEDSGIQFNNQLRDDEQFNIVDYLYFYNGGGVAVGDINNDGLEDIYFTGNQVDNKLYLNKGQLKFEDITASAGVASPRPWKTGVTMVDINADGLLDIYVCRVGKYKGISGTNELYINNGDLTFTESAELFGLDFKGFSTQAGFFDMDNDGDLDAYLLNHSVHTERSYGKSSLRNEIDTLAGDRLFINEDGLFVDITTEAGIYSSQIGYGLGIGFSDINWDGYTDIYISNDFHENDYLYINNGDGTFKESIHEWVTHSSRSSMGNDIADLNNDAKPEIMTLDMLPSDETVLKNSAGEESHDIYMLKRSFGYEKQFARNMLQWNNGDSTFSEIGLMLGIADTDWSWAPLFADYNLDGRKDLFITNGIVRRPNDLDYIMYLSSDEMRSNESDISDSTLVSKMPWGKVPNYFFENKPRMEFIDRSKNWISPVETFSNGAAYADLDNDGDLDLVVNNINDKAQILKNNANEVNYLKVKVAGDRSNTQGIGAKVLVYAGGKQQYQEIFVERGFQSRVTNLAIFGVDTLTKADSVVVIWPGQQKAVFKDVAANQTLIAKPDQSSGKYLPIKSEEKPLLVEVTESSNLRFQHYENTFDDFNWQYLIPHAFSREGPDITVGDVNGDQLEDVYISGASQNNGMLYVQTQEGTFNKHSPEVFRDRAVYEETAVSFFDADADQDLDLYIGSAGNEFQSPNPKLRDQILLNDGSGQFTPDQNALQQEFRNTSVVRPSDIDQDGDLDLFVGSRVVTNQYGRVPESGIYFNIGPGRFRNETEAIAPKLRLVGMVTDAVWADVDGDQVEDLVVVGEWMKITVFLNKGGKLEPADMPSLNQTEGWWNTIEKTDIDHDGDWDFVVGNYGLNTKLNPTIDDPIRMYVKDFDGNTFLDQIITYSKDGKEYTMATKDELGKQMPLVKKSFTQYSQFSGKTVGEIFQPEALRSSFQYDANTFQSMVLLNEGGTFKKIPLPDRAQIAPVFAVESLDLNGDGWQDLVIGGNLEWATTYFGAHDSSYGLVLIGDGTGNFEPLSSRESGFLVKGDIRSIKHVKGSENDFIVVGRNHDTALVYKIN